MDRPTLARLEASYTVASVLLARVIPQPFPPGSDVIFSTAPGSTYPTSAPLVEEFVLEPGRYVIRAHVTHFQSIGPFPAGPTASVSTEELDVEFTFEALTEPFCTSVAGTSGIPATMDAFGIPSVATPGFLLGVRGAAPANFGLFFYGDSRQATPFGSGTLCVGGGIVRMGGPILTDASGSAALAVDPTDPAIASSSGPIVPGATLHFQF